MQLVNVGRKLTHQLTHCFNLIRFVFEQDQVVTNTEKFWDTKGNPVVYFSKYWKLLWSRDEWADMLFIARRNRDECADPLFIARRNPKTIMHTV